MPECIEKFRRWNCPIIMVGMLESFLSSPGHRDYALVMDFERGNEPTP
jgi:hypothetical protein